MSTHAGILIGLHVGDAKMRIRFAVGDGLHSAVESGMYI